MILPVRMCTVVIAMQEEDAPFKELDKKPKHPHNRAKNKRDLAALSATLDDESPSDPIEEEEGEKGPVTKLYGEGLHAYAAGKRLERDRLKVPVCGVGLGDRLSRPAMITPALAFRLLQANGRQKTITCRASTTLLMVVCHATPTATWKFSPTPCCLPVRESPGIPCGPQRGDCY